ncbi:sigma-70 family RNA polymerase sigma factor [Synechocystis sp. PCC 7509]|uniref:sigma-70 family RNA polymerase sigma factor n=1 Tax=Synechocystis sp. PCC 7509 TaxID=927677 RepID=UPI00048C4D04|nr:sigma-70 family RNA polymerase sigma factor [Synechocystis sp. PCC 7509]
MANYSAISVQNEQNLIEICQKMLLAPKKEALTHSEKRLGDRAFAELLERYNRWIWKQINSIPRLDSDDAYSAALEGFQKAITTFDLTTGNALASWAYHCVRGALGTVLRNQLGQAARVEKLAATTSLVYEDELKDPYEEEQLHQSVEKLHGATNQLSKTAQQIVSKRNEGMKFAAIGAELGKSSDAVRMAYNRAIAALNQMLAKQPEVVVPSEVIVTQENQSAVQIPAANWMKRLWSRSRVNVRFLKGGHILSRTIGEISMTRQLLGSTRAPLHKPRTKARTKFIDSPALKYISWLTVALLVLYRMLMGEWLVLLVCGVGGTIAALLWQHWRAISKHHRQQLLFGLCAVLSWCFFTLHTPAYALFFDTLETGLTQMFARFGVADTTSFPLWIGALFRILGIVFIGILALRFGRSRDEDDEGTRQITGKVVQVIGALVIFDAMLELFTG